MKTYNVTFLREFSVQVEADDIKDAEQLARQIVAQFPADTCKLTSVIEGEAIPIPAIKPKRRRAAREGLARSR